MKIAKKLTTYIMILSFAGFLLGFTPNTAISKTSGQSTMVPMNFTDLAQKAKPGVVNIRTVKIVKGGGRVFRHFFGKPFGDNDPFKDFFGPNPGQDPQREFKQRSLGSGFIIDRKGYIVTNNHVVENADQIKVKLANEKEFDAKIVGRDPKTDLALIKIAASSDLVPLKIGDSDALKVGTWVVAIGSPFGLEQTVTAGIVSAKGRIIGSGPYDDFIQTDASINPGNSGGPLINMKGEVVGINTAIIASGQGIGFAIPINLADGIIAQLKTSGEVTRGWLGVGIQDLTPELAEYYKVKDKKGVLVTHVFKGDPADTGGIKAKDIIIKIDGKPVPTARELSGTIAGIAVGKKIAILLIRDGKEKTVYIKIAKRKDDESLVSKETESSNGLGLMASELTPEIAKQLGFDENEMGVMITGVKPGSKGELAGVRQGDLIKEINRKPVSTLNDYQKKMQKIKKGETIHLLIKRSRIGFIVIKITK
ncbi:MAG: Do family serine endopeptidase [Desulfobacterales bacterium]|nr:Do family serine endopeptidase [Desulfobacterales bacterium]MDX2508636.1 Do family serine endopeptidase [Desulfobacterales bacterium]